MLSIKNNTTYKETVKYSKFISLIFKIFDIEEVNKILEKVKEEYPNANHYCYGYVIDNNTICSDDREPSKTAGLPILNAIINNNLNYTLIIVVRYFGGIKLGTGLLTRTYSKMAKEVINCADIIALEEGYDITITFDYPSIKTIDYILSNEKILKKTFDKEIIYNAYVNKDIIDKLSNYKITINKKIYIEK